MCLVICVLVRRDVCECDRVLLVHVQAYIIILTNPLIWHSKTHNRGVMYTKSA